MAKQLAKFAHSSLRAWLLLLGFSILNLAPLLANAGSAAKAALTAATLARYVVRFDEPSLIQYNTKVRSSRPGAIPLKKAANGRTRLDINSTQAKSYLEQLRSAQGRHLSNIAAEIGRMPTALYSMRHALDAAVVMLSPEEAQKVGNVPGIVAIDPDKQFELESDIGPGFTGAASVWWGTKASEDTILAEGFQEDPGSFGDGMVIGMIDTGYNSMSPSFQETDFKHYKISNAMGHGVFLGQCDVPGISIAGCNDKVIGAYDELNLVSGLSTTYSIEDSAGHGSHTAGVAAGNQRYGSFNGYTAFLSGVAPHANLVIYRACSPSTGCWWSVTAASIDQAVADGIIDVLNFSISSGSSWPYSDPVAEALLSATEAGIFVSAAAGNTSQSLQQVAGTVMNPAPWITTVAAGTHSGGAIALGIRAAEQADQLAPFSLLGPAKSVDVIKPDVQAPGVNSLAATYNDGSEFGADRLSLMNGTSAATAHLSGSAALLLAMHPNWTPLEAKSAFIMTGKESGLTKADELTASGFFDRGGGRVQEFVASNAGLVMNETSDRLYNAQVSTAATSTLNLSSMQNRACAGGCSFERMWRNTQDRDVTWMVSVLSDVNSPVVTPSVSSFIVGAFSYSPLVSFAVDTTLLPADGTFHFAEVLLQAADAKLPPLHIPLAVRVPVN